MGDLENGIEVKAFFKRVNGFWRITLDGPGWLLVDVASETRNNDSVLEFGDEPIAFNGPTQLELVQIDKFNRRRLPIIADE